ncbi:MAG TPA: hypothetical protein VGB92_11180 [Longimicrobium sp.]
MILRASVGAVGGLFCFTMRAVPSRYRFSVARGVAGAFTPLLFNRALTRWVQKATVLETDQDYVLSQLVALLKNSGTKLDVPLAIDGLEHLDAAISAGRGVLLTGPHTFLSIVAIRHLHNRGYDVATVSRYPYRVPAGEVSAVPRIPLTPMFLRAVRDAWGQGKVVFTMTDRRDAADGKTISFEVAGGTVHFTDGLLRFAARRSAVTLFLASRTVDGKVLTTIMNPADGRPGDAGLQEFVECVQEYAKSLRARPGLTDRA